LTARRPGMPTIRLLGHERYDSLVANRCAPRIVYGSPISCRHRGSTGIATTGCWRRITRSGQSSRRCPMQEAERQCLRKSGTGFSPCRSFPARASPSPSPAPTRLPIAAARARDHRRRRIEHAALDCPPNTLNGHDIPLHADWIEGERILNEVIYECQRSLEEIGHAKLDQEPRSWARGWDCGGRWRGGERANTSTETT
jgi:hypothetical protein